MFASNNITWQKKMAIINGTENSDNIDNPSSDDLVYLGAGNDSFTPGNGKDTVYGGSGADNIDSTLAYSTLQTVVYGESGDDKIDAKFFFYETKLYGGDGFDTIFGGSGSDAIFGGNNNDTLIGLNGNDRIYGEESNDLIVGQNGADTLSGGNGDDTLSGQVYDGQADYVPGFNFGSGFSNVDAKDVLYGGGGADTFVLCNNKSTFYGDFGSADFASIEDFKSGEDKIKLLGSSSNYLLDGSSGDTIIYELYSLDQIAIVKNDSDLNFSSDFTFV